MIDALLQGLGLKKTPLILGLIGSVIALKWIEAVGVWGRTCAVFIGCAAAQVGTPLALKFFEFHNEYEGGISFIIGLFSMSIIGAVMKAINQADLWALVKEWFSKK